MTAESSGSNCNRTLTKKTDAAARLGRKRSLGRLAIDIEGSKKSVLIAGDQGVALGEESLDETLAALAQRRGGPGVRPPAFVEIGHVLDHREQERVARPGDRLQRLHSLAGLQGPLPARLIRFPLADPQKTPYGRAHIWSR
jgi:hypothetical protein